MVFRWGTDYTFINMECLQDGRHPPPSVRSSVRQGSFFSSIDTNLAKDGALSTPLPTRSKLEGGAPSKPPSTGSSHKVRCRLHVLRFCPRTVYFLNRSRHGARLTAGIFYTISKLIRGGASSTTHNMELTQGGTPTTPSTCSLSMLRHHLHHHRRGACLKRGLVDTTV